MMDFNDDDLLNGDHSFKMWFKIMWRNGYIQAATAAVVLIILFLIYYDEGGIGTYIGLAVPSSALIVIIYKGFYQFWQDLKNGRSR